MPVTGELLIGTPGFLPPWRLRATEAESDLLTAGPRGLPHAMERLLQPRQPPLAMAKSAPGTPQYN